MVAEGNIDIGAGAAVELQSSVLAGWLCCTLWLGSTVWEPLPEQDVTQLSLGVSSGGRKLVTDGRRVASAPLE